MLQHLRVHWLLGPGAAGAAVVGVPQLGGHVGDAHVLLHAAAGGSVDGLLLLLLLLRAHGAVDRLLLLLLPHRPVDVAVRGVDGVAAALVLLLVLLDAGHGVDPLVVEGLEVPAVVVGGVEGAPGLARGHRDGAAVDPGGQGVVRAGVRARVVRRAPAERASLPATVVLLQVRRRRREGVELLLAVVVEDLLHRGSLARGGGGGQGDGRGGGGGGVGQV